MTNETKEPKRRFDGVPGKMLKTPPRPKEAKGNEQSKRKHGRGGVPQKP